MSFRKLIRYVTLSLLPAVLSLTTLTSRLQAQSRVTGTATSVQETDDKDKVDTYTRFVENYKTNKPVAYETAKVYLQRHGKENDQYVQYIIAWVADYEKGIHRNELWKLAYTDRNFVEAFKLGKQVLAESPEHLDSLIALGNAGYLAAGAQNESYNSEALAYAQKAIQLIESGKTPEAWDPFKGKEDTLAYLYATVGLIKLKTAPTEAIDALLKTAQLNSELKKVPSTYIYLGSAYQKGPYAKLSGDFQKNFGDKPESPESKQALDKLNQVIDRIIDAYARAVAIAGNDAAFAQSKTAWMATLTTFYKFRHDNTDAGLTEFIAGVLSKPLPPRI